MAKRWKVILNNPLTFHLKSIKKEKIDFIMKILSGIIPKNENTIPLHLGSVNRVLMNERKKICLRHY
jgi:hypothetical protein